MNRFLFIYLPLLVAAVAAGQAAATVAVDVSAQKYAAHPGDMFPVDYIVSWEGAPGAYTVLPPQLPIVAWGVAELLAIRTRSFGDRHETCVTVGYLAEEAGAYTAPALSLRVVSWDEPGITGITALDEVTPTQVLEAASVIVTVRASRVRLWVGIVAVALLALGVLLWRETRKRRLAAVTEPALTPSEQAQALLHEARRSRLDGDFYAFYRALGRALECIELNAHRDSSPGDALSPDSRKTLHAKLKQAIDDTGYRGVRPSDDMMEGDFKDVERIIAQELQCATKEN